MIRSTNNTWRIIYTNKLTALLAFLRNDECSLYISNIYIFLFININGFLKIWTICAEGDGGGGRGEYNENIVIYLLFIPIWKNLMEEYPPSDSRYILLILINIYDLQKQSKKLLHARQIYNMWNIILYRYFV